MEQSISSKKFKGKNILLIGIGPLGLTTMTLLSKYHSGNIYVIDKRKIDYNDIRLGIYKKKFFGESRVEITKQLFEDNNLEFASGTLTEKENLKKFKNSDIVVLCSDNFALEFHNTVNILCIKNNKPFISARITRNEGEVGPLVIPKKSPCFKCYEIRLKSNIEEFDSYIGFKRKSTKLNDSLLLNIVASYTILEISKVLNSELDMLLTLGHVLRINTFDYTNNLDKVFKIPNCPVCSK